MAHTCPDCGCTCYCHGDIDDIILDNDKDVNACEHCVGQDNSEDDVLSYRELQNESDPFLETDDTELEKLYEKELKQWNETPSLRMRICSFLHIDNLHFRCA